MRIFISGSNGQLGTELIRQLNAGGSKLGDIPAAYDQAEIFHPEIDTLDLCEEGPVKAYFREIRPDIVFHCAAMTNVHGCEEMLEQAERINGTAVRYIAEACETAGAKLAIVSTDYVFSGDASSPYRENDPCQPQTVYGRSKRLGELNALQYCSRTFVVRTAWLYGLHGKNFVKTILRKARESATIRVVSDQFGDPTNAEDLAYHLLRLAVTEKYGIYHCTGNGVCSWYEFAKEIVELAGLDCQVLPCTSAEYPQKAKRPAYSALDHGALRAAVGDGMRPWREALRDYISREKEMS